jgi:hypothetical protein
MEVYIIALIFILANTYFSFKAGETSGRFEGIISITQFYKDKNVLKDKKKILGFKKWPLPIQVLYGNPDPKLFKE